MAKVSWIFKTIKFTKNRPYNYNPDGCYVVDNKLENRRKQMKVTVVTPVYNAEKYLRKTIDSVINQSIGLENIEYILVDDCSTDSSRDILLEYSAKYDNIIAVFLECNTTVAMRKNSKNTTVNCFSLFIRLSPLCMLSVNSYCCCHHRKQCAVSTSNRWNTIKKRPL